MVARSDSCSICFTMSTSPSLTFSATLPMNPSHTITSDLARVNVAALHVADEIDRQALEQRRRGARGFVALVLFLADREQADPGARLVQHHAGIDLAHHGELRQHARRTIHVGAHVDHHHGLADQGRENARQRWTVHARGSRPAPSWRWP